MICAVFQLPKYTLLAVEKPCDCIIHSPGHMLFTRVSPLLNVLSTFHPNK